MRISSNCLALFVRSKFYLRQMISIACGVAIGVFLSLLLAPLLDRMCMFDNRLVISGRYSALLANSPSSASFQHENGNNSSKQIGAEISSSSVTSSSQPQNQQPPITAKNRPHFLSHELGIRNKLLSVTIISSHNDLPLVESLYQNLYHGYSESTTVPFSVVSILSGQQSLISSLEHEIKANLSNFLTMRLSDSQLNNSPNFQVGQYVDDQGVANREINNAGNNEDLAYTRHLTQLVAETLFKVAEQYRTQFDWFAIAFPQVYVRFEKLYDELMMMSPTYDRLLMVPQFGDSGYSCESANLATQTTAKRPFKSILLSNKLMNDIFVAFESSALCPRDTSVRFESLDCLDNLFKHACIASHARDIERFQVSDFPNDASLLPNIANSWAVYPVTSADHYRVLNKLFLENDYNNSLVELGLVREELARLVGHLPSGENKASWPVDVQPPLKPKQRFDIAPWQFLNASHVFFTDEYTTVQVLAGPDLEDVQGVTAAAITFIEKSYPQRFKFLSLESGYRKFDPVRGMEYLLYLLFDDQETSGKVLKFMHVLKPLNRLEPINAPHVTEDAVITLVVPVFVDDSDEAEETGVAFLEQVLSLLKVGDRLKLWLLLVYPSSTTAVDPFMKLKSLVADGESQFPGRLAWLSVQTSHRSSLHLFEAVVRSRQNGGKDTEDWLVLMVPPESLLSREFLNRVRLMAIRKYQVYFPIAFSQYHPGLISEPLLLSAINGATSPAPNNQPGASSTPSPTTSSSESTNVVDLTSRHGHFDQFDFDTAAFYLSDYSDCRRNGNKNEQQLAPVDVADVFLACTQLHVFRAVDPGLKRLYRQSSTSCDSFTSSDQALESCRARLEIGLGNRKHMAAKLSEHVQSAASVAPGPKLEDSAAAPQAAGLVKNMVAQKIVDEDRDYEDHNGDLVNING